VEDRHGIVRARLEALGEEEMPEAMGVTAAEREAIV